MKGFLINFDKTTRDRLDYVAKEFGMDKANCIRMLINDEYNYFIENKKIRKQMDNYYKRKGK